MGQTPKSSLGILWCVTLLDRPKKVVAPSRGIEDVNISKKSERTQVPTSNVSRKFAMKVSIATYGFPSPKFSFQCQSVNRDRWSLKFQVNPLHLRLLQTNTIQTVRQP